MNNSEAKRLCVAIEKHIEKARLLAVRIKERHPVGEEFYEAMQIEGCCYSINVLSIFEDCILACETQAAN